MRKYIELDVTDIAPGRFGYEDYPALFFIDDVSAVVDDRIYIKGGPENGFRSRDLSFDEIKQLILEGE